MTHKLFIIWRKLNFKHVGGKASNVLESGEDELQRGCDCFEAGPRAISVDSQ